MITQRKVQSETEGQVVKPFYIFLVLGSSTVVSYYSIYDPLEYQNCYAAITHLRITTHSVNT